MEPKHALSIFDLRVPFVTRLYAFAIPSTQIHISLICNICLNTQHLHKSNYGTHKLWEARIDTNKNLNIKYKFGLSLSATHVCTPCEGEERVAAQAEGLEPHVGCVHPRRLRERPAHRAQRDREFPPQAEHRAVRQTPDAHQQFVFRKWPVVTSSEGSGSNTELFSRAT